MGRDDDGLIRAELSAVFADLEGRPEPDWDSLSDRLDSRPPANRLAPVRIALAAAVLLILGGATATIPVLRKRAVILEENRIFLESVLADGLFETSRTSTLWEPELSGLFDPES